MFEPHRRHCVVSLSNTLILSTGSTQEDPCFITERLLMGHKESNQTKQRNEPVKTTILSHHRFRSAMDAAYEEIGPATRKGWFPVGLLLFLQQSTDTIIDISSYWCIDGADTIIKVMAIMSMYSAIKIIQYESLAESDRLHILFEAV